MLPGLTSLCKAIATVDNKSTRSGRRKILFIGWETYHRNYDRVKDRAVLPHTSMLSMAYCQTLFKLATLVICWQVAKGTITDIYNFLPRIAVKVSGITAKRLYGNY